ncbi:MAG: hypothetical protein ACJARX_001278 [Psychroserpens sp.]|uniref:T9SS type A sorting domain-containing protein n=1 Tax=Psychroserpens sp. TaxID=2020870 RepID=UPI0039E2B427
MQFYPNPVSNKLTISISECIQKVTINTVLGEKLKTILIDDLKDFKIDFTNYESGIYFMSLVSSHGEEIIEVIKK